jgi:hypothetical protein
LTVSLACGNNSGADRNGGMPFDGMLHRGVVPPKPSLVEKLNEFNLESVKSLILGTRSLLSGQKLPCSPFEGISQQITAAQGFVGFARLLKRVNAEAIPVNFPDSRGEQPTFRAELNSSAAEVLKRASPTCPRSPCRRSLLLARRGQSSGLAAARIPCFNR